MSLEEILRKERPGKRVLSIQSHVVSGYAGNKCSVFPLQLHGFEVDFINSVQFSNHTGYPHVLGQKLTEKELDGLYQGLKKNSINKYSHVLTGYCGNPTFLNKIADIVVELKSINPDLYFVCDPVLGDNGQYYTPKELLTIYRDRVLPLADVITPNAFELGELSGIEVNNQEDCFKAIDQLHLKNPKISIIIMTSGVFSEEKDIMYCFASQKITSGNIQKFKFIIPVIKGVFVGTGDVFTSLLVVWLTEFNGDLKRAVANVISTLQLLLRKTSESAFLQSKTPSAAQCELQLIESRLDLLFPKENVIQVYQL